MGGGGPGIAGRGAIDSVFEVDVEVDDDDDDDDDDDELDSLLSILAVTVACLSFILVELTLTVQIKIWYDI